MDLVGVEVDEEVVDLVQDLLRARVGAVDLVDDDHGGELGFEGLGENVAGLRQRAFGGVDQQEDAVDHLEGALHLTAEVGVAGRVDDVDLVVVVVERGVLGEDGDAALALQVVGVHDALGDRFVGAEGAGLAEHGVDQGGLAVVDVGDDGDVEDGLEGGLRGRLLDGRAATWSVRWGVEVSGFGMVWGLLNAGDFPVWLRLGRVEIWPKGENARHH